MKPHKLTPDEINELIRQQVEQEMPRPKGGFANSDAEDFWRKQSDARFLDLSNQWEILESEEL